MSSFYGSDLKKNRTSLLSSRRTSLNGDNSNIVKPSIKIVNNLEKIVFKFYGETTSMNNRELKLKNEGIQPI
jgi:hypothetical protein